MTEVYLILCKEYSVFLEEILVVLKTLTELELCPLHSTLTNPFLNILIHKYSAATEVLPMAAPVGQEILHGRVCIYISIV